MKKTFIVGLFLSLFLSACAGMNPNPGERTADMARNSGDYNRELSLIKPAAEKGEPWAQLRLGNHYEKGLTVRNIPEAIAWYTKCAVQKGEGGWANGMLAGSTGKLGYFNQNTDALIAQWRLASIYSSGVDVEPNLIKAFLLIENVVKESKGESLFFCCEWLKGGGFYISPNMINETKVNITKSMSETQKAEAQKLSSTWTPQNGL